MNLFVFDANSSRLTPPVKTLDQFPVFSQKRPFLVTRTQSLADLESSRGLHSRSRTSESRTSRRLRRPSCRVRHRIRLNLVRISLKTLPLLRFPSRELFLQTNSVLYRNKNFSKTFFRCKRSQTLRTQQCSRQWKTVMQRCCSDRSSRKTT